MRPFFSIIIPTYNSARTIDCCLESILNQNFGNFEILIIDGISSDNTLTIARDYDDNRIKIFSEPDKGIYDAMNKGILRSKGEWLYFIGSDDTLFDNDVLNDVFIQLSNQEVNVIYGNVLMMQSGLINDGEFNFEKIQTNLICHQAIFYQKKVFEILGGYSIRYKVYADADFNLKWFFSERISNRFFNRIIAKYSETGYSSVQKDDFFFDELPEKLVKLGTNKLNLSKLKEQATYAAINNKRNKKYLQFVYFKAIYIYCRVADAAKRKYYLLLKLL
ncbi:glycosyltransferase family 2 protein [Spirosoma fluviale]|uniref:Glycosyl transferase family 2 n=1 Tax=Spirosoma fluviale TaxID=1597977 RepID=A0A286FEF0_9BACT|nr:glycosyltransferase family 2 protein [Spirosoma fluviale]SOD81204.1 Glycosyl transferase family 2 [Spirosoma fluviale]